MESTLRRGAGEPGLKLIETLGWDGKQFARLDLHLARLAGSALLLGWAVDLATAKDAVQSAVSSSPARVRLTLAVDGAAEVAVTTMPKKATLWQVGLSDQTLMSFDPWLCVKSTRREAYDAARAALLPGFDEVILQNERGEVCDGSITTVFFDAGDGLCTPPLQCGLLPGVLRAEMLAQGTLREAVLQVTDLTHVQLWVGNSLRGLIRAVYN